MDLLEYYDSRQNILDIERSTLYLLSEELKKFKKEKGLKDFTDLLEDFIHKEVHPSFEVLFIKLKSHFRDFRPFLAQHSHGGIGW